MNIYTIKNTITKLDIKPIEKAQLICYFAVMFTNLKVIEIAKEINRKHSTVIYSRRVVINRKQFDRDYFNKIETIKQKLTEIPF